MLDPPRPPTAPPAGIAPPAADRARLADSPSSTAALQQPPSALDARTPDTQLNDPVAAPAAATGAGTSDASEAQAPPQASSAAEALWGLAVMTAGYLHLSVSLYALPSLLPTIAEDLALNDTQGGLITTGYTVSGGTPSPPLSQPQRRGLHACPQPA